MLYFSMCILKKDVGAMAKALRELSISSGFVVRPTLLDRLQTTGSVDDFYTDFAQLVLAHANSISGTHNVSPRRVFELAFKVLQMAHATGQYRLFSENLLPWLEEKWEFIWQHQRFLLDRPSLHEVAINAAIGQKDVPTQVKVVDILSAILPSLGVSNQKELQEILSGFSG